MVSDMFKMGHNLTFFNHGAVTAGAEDDETGD
jgi:hypothetical protein